MIFAILPILVIGGIVALVIRIVSNGNEGTRQESGVSLRRFFQYATLLAVLIIVGIGATGLLSELLPGGTVISRDTAGSARSIAFLIIGVPTLYGLAKWVSRSLTETDDRSSFAWAAYVTIASLSGLVVGGIAAAALASAVLGLSDEYDPGSLAMLIVWGAIWIVHYRIAETNGRTGRFRFHLLAGSLVGLVATALAFGFALGTVLSSIYESIFSVRLASSGDDLALAGIGLVIGGAIWWRYWLSISSKLDRDSLWHAYVLLAGVLGSLITFVTAASVLIFTSLDWLFGDAEATAALHFEEMPGVMAAIVVGAGSWAYHRAVLASSEPASRMETNRVYEYLVSAVGLLAAASGLTIVVIAVIQSVFPADILSRDSGIEPLLGAITMLIVGGPIWWRYWSAIQRERHLLSAAELTSPTRRIYVFALFGLGGVVALISLLTLVVQVLEDALDGSFGSQTIQGVRIPIAFVITVGAVAAYHWAIHKEDNLDRPADEEGTLIPTVSSVVLVSADGTEVAAAVTRETGVRVRVWDQADGETTAETADVIDVVEAIRTASHARLLIIARSSGVEALPFTERR